MKATVFLLMMLSAEAADENERGPESGQTHDTAPHEGEEVFFKSVDQDQDGFLDENEFLEHLWADRTVSFVSFFDADEDKDGFLKDAELESERNNGQTFRQFAVLTESLDKEGGYLARDAYEEAVKLSWKSKAKKAMASADSNNDQKLSQQEFIPLYETMVEEAKERLFAESDSNGDSGVESAEWLAMLWKGGFINKREAATTFFEVADVNQDKTLTLEEFLAHDSKNTKDTFDTMVPTDQEDRTKVSLHSFNLFLDHEFHYLATTTFTGADADSDGKVSKAEFLQHHDFGHSLEL